MINTLALTVICNCWQSLFMPLVNTLRVAKNICIAKLCGHPGREYASYSRRTVSVKSYRPPEIRAQQGA